MLYHFSAQHLDHKIAFHFLFLIHVQGKTEISKQRIFLFAQHEAQLQKYNSFYYRLDILVLFSRTETWRVDGVFTIGI